MYFHAIHPINIHKFFRKIQKAKLFDSFAFAIITYFVKMDLRLTHGSITKWNALSATVSIPENPA